MRSLESWSAQKIHAVSKLGDAASVVTRKRVAVRSRLPWVYFILEHV